MDGTARAGAASQVLEMKTMISDPSCIDGVRRKFRILFSSFGGGNSETWIRIHPINPTRAKTENCSEDGERAGTFHRVGLNHEDSMQ